jgi:hypothetical protein
LFDRKGSSRPFATADMRGDETVNVTAPIENSAVDPDVSWATALSAFAILFPLRTPPVFSSFFRGQ